MSALFGYWPGQRFGFGGCQAVDLMQDWARQARTGRYRLNGSATDYETALLELRQPLLTVSVAGDRLTPLSSVDRSAAKARQAPRIAKHYTRPDQTTHRPPTTGGSEIRERCGLV
ncbi:putative alpha/beta hydrolase [Saccharopolyspora phatthalungensis]|uniref:Putative alpha/beta hydrolase n=2 Tax=Saccharopolyspora phatthalungensis TaxID=664693 RepID=A0A840Q8N8_9PSEU|nr:putative alpha/beta hydrolase [Saccharopolyspora phatthalungensis]